MKKKYYEESFKIEKSDLEFKFKKISPTKILSLATIYNNKDFASNEYLFNFALENTDVNLLNKWLPVKETNKDIYWPADMEDDFATLQGLVMKFVSDVLAPVFTQSNK